MSKIWFVTGASRGLGTEIARAALSAGHRVVATGRDVGRLRDLFAGDADRVLCLPLDVTDEAAARSAVVQADARFGRIDVLVNNAGYGLLGPFEEIAPAEIERQFTTNVFGLMHVTRAVLPVMRRQRSGHLFNISSIGGVLGFDGAAIYCATKFAVAGFSESLSLELARFGIHATSVEPGFFRTDFLDARSIQYGEQAIEDYAEVSASIRATYDGYNHRQAGDPAKLGAALVKLAAMSSPPRHYVAGSDALGMSESTLTQRQAELALHRDLSVSTDGDA